MFPLSLSGVKMFNNKLFSLKLVLKSDGESRFCFSVSKKVAKSAVARNRLRRAGYHLLARYLPEIKSNILAVFYFKSMPQDNEEIAKNMKSILKESKLIK